MTTTISFDIATDRKIAATKALKQAAPKLKNAKACIDARQFTFPTEHSALITAALAPFVTNLRMKDRPDADQKKDVKFGEAEDRFAKALDSLGERVVTKTTNVSARVLNAAAEFIEKL